MAATKSGVGLNPRRSLEFPRAFYCMFIAEWREFWEWMALREAGRWLGVDRKRALRMKLWQGKLRSEEKKGRARWSWGTPVLGIEAFDLD